MRLEYNDEAVLKVESNRGRYSIESNQQIALEQSILIAEDKLKAKLAFRSTAFFKSVQVFTLTEKRRL